MEPISTPSFSVFDGLYCEEEGIDDDYGCIDNGGEDYVGKGDLVWTDEELLDLISKEKGTQLGFNGFLCDDLMAVARREAVDWILRVKGFFGFTNLSCVLAVNYFDRFVSNLKLTRDNPWMGQLVAVACLSLAAKVEETRVPLLLDLQVEESKYVFEAKTIKRMELLVLSALQWRMNPVTPISFFDHITRRLGLKEHLHYEFLRTCESLLFSVISDSRFMSYLPSILATAIMLHVIKEVEPFNQMDYHIQLLEVIKASKEKVNQCYNLILELSNKQDRGSKRQHQSTPGSPNGVIDSYFSGDSSNDSFSLPRFKRMRSQDQ